MYTYLSLLHPATGSGVLWWVGLSVCLSVSCMYVGLCPRTCHERRKLTQTLPSFPCMLSVAVARISSGGVAIWRGGSTSRFVDDVIVAHSRPAKGDVSWPSTRWLISAGSTYLTPQRVLKLTHQGAAPNRRRSLMSTIAFFVQSALLGSPIFLLLYGG